jgi:hypothetical protein
MLAFRALVKLVTHQCSESEHITCRNAGKQLGVVYGSCQRVQQYGD